MSPRSPAPTQPHHGHRADPRYGTAADPQVFQTITERARISGFEIKGQYDWGAFGGRKYAPLVRENTRRQPRHRPAHQLRRSCVTGSGHHVRHGGLGTAVSTCATMQQRRPRTSTAHLPSNRPIRNSRFRRRRHRDLLHSGVPEEHAPEPGRAQPHQTRNTGCGPTSMVWPRYPHKRRLYPARPQHARCPGDGFLTLRGVMRCAMQKTAALFERASGFFSWTFCGGAVRSRTGLTGFGNPGHKPLCYRARKPIPR